MNEQKQNIRKNEAHATAEGDRDILRYLILGTQPLDIEMLEKLHTIYSGSDMLYVADIVQRDADFQYLYKQAHDIRDNGRKATREKVLSFLATLIETGQIVFLGPDFQIITETIADEVDEALTLL